MKLDELKIVFCFPGSMFSKNFLESWTRTMAWCRTNNILHTMSCKQSCNIYYVRSLCLGADVSRGEDQKPFNGQLDYTHIVWIDSDIVWRPNDIETLISRDLDVVAGLYLMDDNVHYAAVERWDETYFAENLSFKFLTPADLYMKGGKPFKVSYSGMGMMVVKHGVFERLKYPWFRALDVRIGSMVDFTMEDVSFCLRAKEEAGVDVYVDPTVIVGHEKKKILM